MSNPELLLLCTGAVLFLLIAWGTVARKAWGIHLGRVTCPRCLRPVPAGSLSRLLFGRRQCLECDTIMDKWGREILPSRRDRIGATKAAKK